MTGPRHDPAVTRAWATAGTERLLGLLGTVPDEALAGPSLLPGWTRAHVVAHVARNADALGRLAAWARTGVETPMYPSRRARDAEIEQTAARPRGALREDLARSAADLHAAFDALDATTWGATVVAGRGREVPASLLPWLRTREVWLHAADLDAGQGPAAALADAPAGLLPELLTDVTRTLSRADDCPTAVLGTTGTDASWELGHPGAGGDPAGVRGPLTSLVLWVTGRTVPVDLEVAGGGSLPVLPRWL